MGLPLSLSPPPLLSSLYSPGPTEAPPLAAEASREGPPFPLVPCSQPWSRKPSLPQEGQQMGRLVVEKGQSCKPWKNKNQFCKSVKSQTVLVLDWEALILVLCLSFPEEMTSNKWQFPFWPQKRLRNIIQASSPSRSGGRLGCRRGNTL